MKYLVVVGPCVQVCHTDHFMENLDGVGGFHASEIVLPDKVQRFFAHKDGIRRVPEIGVELVCYFCKDLAVRLFEDFFAFGAIRLVVGGLIGLVVDMADTDDKLGFGGFIKFQLRKARALEGLITGNDLHAAAPCCSSWRHHRRTWRGQWHAPDDHPKCRLPDNHRDAGCSG